MTPTANEDARKEQTRSLRLEGAGSSLTVGSYFINGVLNGLRFVFFIVAIISMNLNWPADAAQFLTVLRFLAGSSLICFLTDSRFFVARLISRAFSR